MDLMIDIETLSSDNHAVITTIGAVAFDRNIVSTVDELRKYSFYRRLELDLQIRAGRTVSGATLAWINNQSPVVRDEMLSDSIPRYTPVQVLNEFYEFAKSYSPSWSYGATFDHVIVQDLYNHYYKKNPIHYRDMLCMRTLINLTGITCPYIPGNDHNALDDAIRQSLWAQLCFKKLRGE